MYFHWICSSQPLGILLILQCKHHNRPEFQIHFSTVSTPSRCSALWIHACTCQLFFPPERLHKHSVEEKVLPKGTSAWQDGGPSTHHMKMPSGFISACTTIIWFHNYYFIVLFWRFLSPRLKHYYNLVQALTRASLGTAYRRLLMFSYCNRAECCCCFYFMAQVCVCVCVSHSRLSVGLLAASFVKQLHSFSLSNPLTSPHLPLSSFYLLWPLSIFQTAASSLAHSSPANRCLCHHPVPGR